MTKSSLQKAPLRSLSIHLASADLGWISLLGSEGSIWTGGQIDLLREHLPLVLILPSDTSDEVSKKCHELVLAGATAICEPGVWKGERIDYPIFWKMPYERECFSGLDCLDQSNAIEIEVGALGRGMLFRLPFRLQPLWNDRRRARRFVAIGENQTIYEDMAAVVKKNVRRVVVDVIKRAFFKRGQPYVHKWYFPGRNRSVLCFRGDADGGPRVNFQRWLDTVRPFASCTSVFFCTNQYLRKRDLISAAASAGLEVGSHNHWHIVFSDRLTNSIALTRAERVLNSAACRPRGFVAPAFFWHPTLYRLLEQRGYMYASCFRLNHDGIPYFPVVGGRIGSVLEIPFHCLGDRFPTCDVPLESNITRSFFKAMIEKKYAAGEPMFLYGHPDVPGRMGTTPELVRLILESALSHSDVKPWQLSPYAKWWCKRTNCPVECWYDATSSRFRSCVGLGSSEVVDDLMVRVEFPDGASYMVDPATCHPSGLPRNAMLPFTSLQMPAADDVGEVVYYGPDPAGSFLNYRTRRTIRRFAEAYYRVYMPWLNHNSRLK